eukprot:SAG31_NODE_5143_length_2718_cov_1.647957_3_plen_244_part_00
MDFITNLAPSYTNKYDKLLVIKDRHPHLVPELRLELEQMVQNWQARNTEIWKDTISATNPHLFPFNGGEESITRSNGVMEITPVRVRESITRNSQQTWFFNPLTNRDVSNTWANRNKIRRSAMRWIQEHGLITYAASVTVPRYPAPATSEPAHPDRDEAEHTCDTCENLFFHGIHWATRPRGNNQGYTCFDCINSGRSDDPRHHPDTFSTQNIGQPPETAAVETHERDDFEIEECQDIHESED